MSALKEFDLEDFQTQVIKAIEIISYTESLDQLSPRPLSSSFEDSEREAEEIAQRSDIKQLICSALQTVGKDAIEIANAITPVLVGAILAGTITIPLNPILFGWIAIIIFRAGIATFCAHVRPGAE